MKLNKISTRDLGELRIAMKRNHTRKELRLIFLRGTKKLVPNKENLRNYVVE
jgi:hypothetical protein